jgi:chaperonin GroES
MKIKPLQDRVIVKRIDQEEEMRGGIVIPDTAKEKPQEGEIVAAGDGKVLDSGQKVAMSVKAGDRILFGKYSGTEVKIEDEEYLIMREDEVLGILQ